MFNTIHYIFFLDALPSHLHEPLVRLLSQPDQLLGAHCFERVLQLAERQLYRVVLR